MLLQLLCALVFHELTFKNQISREVFDEVVQHAREGRSGGCLPPCFEVAPGMTIEAPNISNAACTDLVVSKTDCELD